jgi:hypothetical protein
MMLHGGRASGWFLLHKGHGPQSPTSICVDHVAALNVNQQPAPENLGEHPDDKSGDLEVMLSLDA